jgi:hypothetical protein
MGLASRAALEAGVGGTNVEVAWGEVAVSITLYDHQPTKRSIPVRQAKNRPRARPDWEVDDFGEGNKGDFMCCGYYLKTLL